jgi:apolipoprotein N-acyltransferase
VRRFLPPRDVALAALASAALFAVSFPPFPFAIAPLALIPVVLLATRAADVEGRPPREVWRDGARTGWWFGLFGYGVALYWIAIALSIYTKLAILGFFGAVVVMAALASGALGSYALVRRLTHLPAAIALPVTWVAWEKITEVFPQLAFPWLPLGLSVATSTRLAQMVDLSGVHGASFWIAAISGLIVDAIVAWRRAEVPSVGGLVARAGAVAGILAAVLGYGRARVDTIPLLHAAPVAVVQPNVPQEDKWQEENRDRIAGMLAAGTRSATDSGRPQLVVWPEVALPGYIAERPEWRDTLVRLVRDTRVPILFGVIDVEWHSGPGEPPDYDYYNAAMLADTSGSFTANPPTRKQYLVPVVERVPFLNPRWFGGMKYFGGYGRGEGAVVYEQPWGRFGVLICYESIFPAQSRALRRAGSDLLINITNDAWFGRSTAPWQHEAHMRLRAIENRAGVVRSANTGISEAIDPLGRVRAPTGLFVPASLTYQTWTTRVTSPYVRFGDVIGWGCILLTAVLIAGPLIARRLRR